MVAHAFVTIAIPFEVGRIDAVKNCLDKIEAERGQHEKLEQKLDRAAFVHFLSITIIEAEAQGDACHLLIEVNADGTIDSAIEELSESIGDLLIEALEAAEVKTSLGAGLAALLRRHHCPAGQGWFATPGVNFDGTPGLSVRRIGDECRLARSIADILDDLPRELTAMQRLEAVRQQLWIDGEKWAFVPAPASVLQAAPSLGPAIFSTLLSALKTVLWPFVLVPVIGFLLALTTTGFASACWVAVLLVLGELLLLIWAYRRLRALETTDVPDDQTPAADHVEKMLQRENRRGSVQNHLAARSIMKRGKLRRVTLRLGLWVAGIIGAYYSRPGFLASTGSIHFARWILLPNTNSLVFLSNYDGAWQSYIEDFIERAAGGVTGIWSNTGGFPRTANLFGKGAKDGDRLRQWTRRQQIPSYVWYSAYPALTFARISLNAAIRQGIALALTEADAVDWLSCFGSSPPPPDAVESNELPTLAFGGLSHLRYGTCLLIGLEKGAAASWLGVVAESVSFGDSRWVASAQVVGLARTGLEKLGVPQDGIGTFAPAFQHGSSHPGRSRALGDKPESWRWGGPHNSVDAVLLLYADTARDLSSLAKAAIATLKAHGNSLVEEIRLDPLPAPKDGKRLRAHEPFGFADGISQPIIRGIRRAPRDSQDLHLVEAGEFILGYSDNRGYLPPSPSVGTNDDPNDRLPAHGANPFRNRPNFADAQPTARRDLGMNGTFLVVRQVAQDVEGFKRFTRETAKRLRDDDRFALAGSEELAELIGAKMVGRWKNGASLVRRSRQPKPGDSYADNDFLFGKEDPLGTTLPVWRTHPPGEPS